MVLIRGIETGFAQQPRQVDIPTALRNASVTYYDKSRIHIIYLRHLRSKQIYDSMSITELQQLCQKKRIPLRGMPDVYPGPTSHPWVQESFRRLHSCLIEALEKAESASTFPKFANLPTGLRYKIYRNSINDLKMVTFVKLPAITQTTPWIRKEALPIFFNRPFVLQSHTTEPTVLVAAKQKLEGGWQVRLKKGPSMRFCCKAPLFYARQIRRLVIFRYLDGDERADRGTWHVDFDAPYPETRRVSWIAEDGHGEGYDGRSRVRMEKFVFEATGRLEKFVDGIVVRGGMLGGEDVGGLIKALEGIKG